MSALPLTALRPLAFPSHAWAALICLRTGRVLALLPSQSEAPPSDLSLLSLLSPLTLSVA